MSKTALAIALILLIGLCAAGAILLTAPQKTAAGPVQLLPTIAPERVSALRLNTTRFERAGTSWTTEDGWPVRVDRVRALLRALSALDGPEDAGGALTSPVRIEIDLDDGATLQLNIDRRALAGRTVAFNDDGRIELDDALIALLPTSDSTWNVTSPMPGLDPTRLSRIEIDTPDTRFRARRLGARWSIEIEEGEEVRASELALRALAERFGAFEYGAFDATASTTDVPDATAMAARFTMTGADSPYAFTIDSERVGEKATRKAHSALPTGVRASGTGNGLDPNDLPLNPLFFAARTATDANTTDVQEIRIDRADGPSYRYERTLEGWRPANPEETLAIGDAEQLLEVMTQTQGAPGRTSEIEFTELGRVTLIGLDGGDLVTLDYGLTESSTLAFRDGVIAWAYPRTDPPRVLRVSMP